MGSLVRYLLLGGAAALQGRYFLSCVASEFRILYRIRYGSAIKYGTIIAMRDSLDSCWDTPIECPMNTLVKSRFMSVMLKLLFAAMLVTSVGCVSVKTEHKIDPIHITMDVNVRLERALEDAFAGLDAKSVAIAEEKGMK